VEVELRDGFQSGVDWSALKNGGGATGAMGVLSGNTSSNTLVRGVQSNLPGFDGSAGSLLANSLSLPGGPGGLFALAIAQEGFQGVLGFLETQGDVQTLSSPRVATLNNQKAVLKVGTDDYFVTGVSSGTTTSTNNSGTTGSNSLPSVTLTSFFSGISLDVTPQVDDANNITLHVHPSVTSVVEKTKQIDLGSIGNYRLPLAIDAGEVRPGPNGYGGLAGEATRDPSFDCAALWIAPSARDHAIAEGFLVVDPATVIATHANQALLGEAHQLLGPDEVREWVDALKARAPALVEAVTPDPLPLAALTRTLRALLADGGARVVCAQRHSYIFIYLLFLFLSGLAFAVRLVFHAVP
jgi:hypothetical protein